MTINTDLIYTGDDFNIVFNTPENAKKHMK